MKVTFWENRTGEGGGGERKAGSELAQMAN